MNGFKICRGWEEVSIFVDAARSASDANTPALGFLPGGAFDRLAKQGKLWVATVGDGTYAGHLLFDYRFPRANVLQIFCAPEFRGKGMAGELIEALKSSLEKEDFLFIKASVAEDLVASNRFWARAGFNVSKRRKGGQTTGRIILERVYELESPQLFSRSGLALRPDNPLGLGSDAPLSMPAYMIDLNVVFDVAHGRSHADAAASLLHASHSGECRVVISTEMADELRRHAKDTKNDPMLRMLGSLPRTPVPRDAMSSPAAADVAAIVFPEKAFPGGLSKNDLSDIRHVITAIAFRATAFVTRDQRILDASSLLEARHSLKVVDPEQLWGGASFQVRDEIAEAESHGFFKVIATSESSDEVLDLIGRCGVDRLAAATKWTCRTAEGGATALRLNDRLVAVSIRGSSDPRTRTETFKMVVDEEADLAAAAARLVIRRSCDTAALKGAGQIRIETPKQQLALREAAYRIGFRPSPDGSMCKVVLGRAVTPFNWTDNRKTLRLEAGVQLPKYAPTWSGDSQLLELQCADGERRHVALAELETLLSPALFCLEGRPATLASIRPKYSEALLGGHMQLSLAPHTEAATHGDRLFLCAPTLIGQFERGGLLFFYQSQAKGAQAIIAVARIVDAYLIRGDEIDEESLRRSVLGVDTLREIGTSPDKAACVFDNPIFLSHPIDLKFLKGIKYQSARLTSVGRLSNVQTMRILEQGFRDA